MDACSRSKCGMSICSSSRTENFNFWYYWLLPLLISWFKSSAQHFPDHELQNRRQPPTICLLPLMVVEYIMRRVRRLDYPLSPCIPIYASFFFIVVYLHMFVVWFMSVQTPWVGVIFRSDFRHWWRCLYGYHYQSDVLWGAGTITTCSPLPCYRIRFVHLIRGDFNALTLPEPLPPARCRVALWYCSVWLGRTSSPLHEVGSNNPDGVENQENQKTKTVSCATVSPFHPYCTVKDILGVVVFLIVFCAVLFFAPEGVGYFVKRRTSMRYVRWKHRSTLRQYGISHSFYAIFACDSSFWERRFGV